MTKDELSELVDLVNASWNQTPFKDDLNKQRKAWWHFLQDLDSGAVQRVIDVMAISGRFPPRPGELRRKVLLGDIPTAIEAWAELQSAREAVYGGSLATPVSELTRKTMKALGDQVNGMHTNGDRDKFFEAYQVATDKLIEERCLLA